MLKTLTKIKISHLLFLLMASSSLLVASLNASEAYAEPGAPSIEKCEGKDIDTAQCKKDYRDCNVEFKKKKAKRIQCKKDAIQNNKKKPDKPKKQNPEDPPGLGEAGDYICGTYENEEDNVHTKFNFGCLGTQFAQNGQGPKNISPILDLSYAFIRFMSVGVGIVLAISMIISGIQYSTSEGNAEVTQKAKARIRAVVLGLILYIFSFAILQFLVPGGVFSAASWIDINDLQLLARPSIWIY